MRPLALLSVLALALPLYAQLSVSWTPIGPHHINGKSTFLESGKLQALAISPADARVMYAGGGFGSANQGPPAQAGIFKTTNGGTSWTAMNQGLTDPIVNALWVDPTNPNLALAGTESDGIFRTTNGGTSWTRIGAYGATSDFVQVTGGVLAATSTGIVRSADGGATWSSVLATTQPVRVFASGGGAVLAGTEDGTLYLQGAGGDTFQSVYQMPNNWAWSLAIDPDAPANMLAIFSLPNVPSTLVRTADAGRTWSTVATGTIPQAVAYASAIKTVFMASADGLFTSTDGGRSFRLVPQARWDMRRLYWNDTDRSLIIGTDQGLMRTANSGVSFTGLSGSVRNSILSGLAVSGPTIFAAVHDFDPMISFDGGDSWTQPSYRSGGTPGGEDGAVLIAGNYCYTATAGGFQYSIDNCRTFRQTGTAALRSKFWVQPGGVNMIAAQPGDPTVVYAAGTGGTAKSTDNGQSFTVLNWPQRNVVSLAIHPKDPNTMLLGANGGLSRTSDGGTTWSPVALPVAGTPTTIAFYPADPRVVVVGLNFGQTHNGGILRSTDGGLTFKLSNTGLPNAVRIPPCCGYDMISLRFSPDGPLALGARTGAFVSADQGQTWTDITGDSISTYFADMAWDGGFLYAATYGGGILRTRMAPATVSAAPATLTFAAGGPAQTIAVSSGADATSFTASVATDAGAWLKVTPASGKTPGTITVSVDATGLAAGEYGGRVTIASPLAVAPAVVNVRLTVAQATPTVIVSGVANGASFEPAIAPGAWVTVRGVNLSDTTRSWGGDDFVGGKLPTQIDGVSVTINGRSAYIYYVSPTQLNVLAPPDAGKGAVPVVVKSPRGTSAPVTATVADVAPAFFLIGASAPAAIHVAGSLIGPVDLYPGATTPAKPGETILLYGTGFGATSPATPAGVVAISAAQLANAASVKIGGLDATVAFAGIISPGLYQLNVVVPDVDGNVSLAAEVAGVQSAPVSLAVKR